MTVVETQITDPDLDFEEPTEAHYVDQDDSMRGYINGDAITAICGKVFVPTRDPLRLPVCPACKEELAKRGGSQED